MAVFRLYTIFRNDCIKDTSAIEYFDFPKNLFIHGFYYCTNNSDPCTINTNLRWINNKRWMNKFSTCRKALLKGKLSLRSHSFPVESNQKIISLSAYRHQGTQCSNTWTCLKTFHVQALLYCMSENLPCLIWWKWSKYIIYAYIYQYTYVKSKFKHIHYT